MKVRFLLIAEIELVEAIEYYNFQLQSLAHQFYSEISNGIDRIILYPDAWTKIGKELDDTSLNNFRMQFIMYTMEMKLLLFQLHIFIENQKLLKKELIEKVEKEK